MLFNTFGNPRHKTLMLIHGLGVSYQVFAPLIEHLQARYCIIAVQVDGFLIDNENKPDTWDLDALNSAIEMKLLPKDTNFVTKERAENWDYEYLLTKLNEETINTPIGRYKNKIIRRYIKMSKTFIVETSARHCHLTAEAVEILYGKGADLIVKKMLSQPGQFACANEKLTVVGPKGSLAMSVLGPVRPANQVELSFTDARTLGIVPPIRESGDTAGTPGLKLVGPAGEIEIADGAIVAKRHIHMTPLDARNKYTIYDNKKVTESESAEQIDLLSDRLERIGYRLDFSRGDYD